MCQLESGNENFPIELDELKERLSANILERSLRQNGNLMQNHPLPLPKEKTLLELQSNRASNIRMCNYRLPFLNITDLWAGGVNRSSHATHGNVIFNIVQMLPWLSRILDLFLIVDVVLFVANAAALSSNVMMLILWNLKCKSWMLRIAAPVSVMFARQCIVSFSVAILC